MLFSNARISITWPQVGQQLLLGQRLFSIKAEVRFNDIFLALTYHSDSLQ
jgi:hypothetical protein